MLIHNEDAVLYFVHITLLTNAFKTSPIVPISYILHISLPVGLFQSREHSNTHTFILRADKTTLEHKPAALSGWKTEKLQEGVEKKRKSPRKKNVKRKTLTCLVFQNGFWGVQQPHLLKIYYYRNNFLYLYIYIYIFPSGEMSPLFLL